MIEIKGKYTTAKIYTNYVEPSCLSQIIQMTNHPAFNSNISIMPDTHAGKGSVIGFTMPITGKIIPNTVGVDIGCGVLCVRIKTQNLDFEKIDEVIKKYIPLGKDINETPVVDMIHLDWSKINKLGAMFINNKYGKKINYSYYWFTDKCKQLGIHQTYAENSLGSLGGGNHFLEMGRSTNNDMWLSVHSGSRNFGKRVCEYWQNVAFKNHNRKLTTELKNGIEEIKKQYHDSEIEKQIKELKVTLGVGIPSGLEYLEGDDYFGYLEDMMFAQYYAQLNRKIIIDTICRECKFEQIESIDSVHNYMDFEDMIIRKGAIRSYENEALVIPLNMRDGILICIGKSNIDWNYSAPHGAGRLMSRSEAKKQLSMDKFQTDMLGVYSNINEKLLDECPEAYKNSSEIIEQIEPTVHIIDKIKTIYNIKSSEEYKYPKKNKL